MQAELWYGKTVLGSHQSLPDAPPTWELERDARGTERKMRTPAAESKQNQAHHRREHRGPDQQKQRPQAGTTDDKENLARTPPLLLFSCYCDGALLAHPSLHGVPVLRSGSLIDLARSFCRRKHCHLGVHATAPYLKTFSVFRDAALWRCFRSWVESEYQKRCFTAGSRLGALKECGSAWPRPW